MSNLPHAVIMMNNALSSDELLNIQNQFFITDTITFDEFNSRLSVDENYIFNIKSQFLRILVLCDDLSNHLNREYADLVIFVKQGMATLLKNNFGPPNITFYVSRFNLFDFLRESGSDQVIARQYINPLKECCCSQNIGFGGIVAIELADSYQSICKNPDSEQNNEDFIKRNFE